MSKYYNANQSKFIKFEGQEYFDDRMFVLYLCKGRVEAGPDGVIITTIYHEQEPIDFVWCVVTYRNCIRYPLYRIDSFYKKDDAVEYIKIIEPETPLISLGGRSPAQLVSYEEYTEWKKDDNLKDYNWQELYTPGGSNATERVYQTKEQFKGIKYKP